MRDLGPAGKVCPTCGALPDHPCLSVKDGSSRLQNFHPARDHDLYHNDPEEN